MKIISGGVCAAKGFKANGVHCGIRHNHSKKDLALIVSEKKATAAAVYTTNLVKGAPLTVTKQNISDGYAQAVICNSGNANTCNANGIEIAEKMCALVEQATGVAVTAGEYKRMKPCEDPRLERFYKWKDQIACTVHEDFSDATFGPELGDRVRDFLMNAMPLLDYMGKFGV